MCRFWNSIRSKKKREGGMEEKIVIKREREKRANQTREFDKWIRKGSTFWRICRNSAPKGQWLHIFANEEPRIINTAAYLHLYMCIFFHVASVWKWIDACGEELNLQILVYCSSTIYYFSLHLKVSGSFCIWRGIAAGNK